ncbi:sll0787 family AIR synthase-like protein [Dyadobacter sp. CY261]|uniref:sll0787 family AIR synthase-like protein n=1 Tax=Dyadobacter sp. CY261 TaxID=2907203 RepID=UPI001F2D63B5|nr:sll0787 family AIR synthase-like protein [Dyadobacter sp. CY261]MCF0072998.1 sll0787 family AIR synthase-like protein [Dyadobacter sp. CY261]
MELKEIVNALSANPLVQDKLLIERTYTHSGTSTFIDPANLLLEAVDTHFEIRNGDDCAAIPNGDGTYTLFAAEGIIQNFVRNSPWFAGYSAVMVNISDICSMGGLPVAVTNVLWAKDQTASEEIWNGMVQASTDYGVPIVGGHTCYGNELNLAVSIIGKARKLLTSFDAKAGDRLLMAIDMDGAYFEHYPFWNASTTSAPAKLRRNMRFMYEIAEAGLCRAAKDISMGGIVGTLGMLMRTSQKGAVIDLDRVPVPENVDLLKWLVSFPSYGYLLTAPEEHVDAIIGKFSSGGITCMSIGEINETSRIALFQNNETAFIN